MTKNIRISLYILIPTIFWMLSGFFVAEKKETVEETKKLFTVGTIVSKAVEFQPLIKLKTI